MDGSFLASVGGSPDHMLTIWDWRAQTVVLRCKAFSQDVLTVRFSQYNKNRLFTSGTGHIRFWEMAQTFTGLKLQGKIGKFGAVDLSDIFSYVEYPSGKLLSSSEHGNLLLWQDDLIQFVIKPQIDDSYDDNTQYTTCHQGNIVYVDICQLNLETENNGLDDETENLETQSYIVSAGVDGFIKFWNDDNIEFFEPTDENPDYEIELIFELQVPSKQNTHIISMVKSSDNSHWIIQDASGYLWKLDSKQFAFSLLMDFHGYRLTGVDTGNNSHSIVSAGFDGTIRSWDLKTCQCTLTKHFGAPINVLIALPQLSFHCMLKKLMSDMK